MHRHDTTGPRGEALRAVERSVQAVLAQLLRAMDTLHADRHLDLGDDTEDADLAFAGEAQDLQEMLGNLLDNACRSARGEVRVRAARDGAMLRITVDDGPGIPPHQRAEVRHFRRFLAPPAAPEPNGIKHLDHSLASRV